MRFKTLLGGGIGKISSAARKSLYGLVICLYGAVTIPSCSTVKYIPVKGDTQVEYRDSIITRLDTITVTRTEVEKVRDYTGLLDTLRLETKGAKATAYVDTVSNTLRGSLEDKVFPLEVVVPVKEEYHLKDSTSTQEIAIPTIVEKQVKVVPKFWRVMGILGIVETLVLCFLSYLKLKSSGFLNKILKIFKK